MNALIVVKIITNDKICIEVNETLSDNKIFKLGFLKKENYLEKNYNEKNELIADINNLIEMGALFSSGWGWSPAEVVSLYKSEALINKAFKVIAWKDPNTYYIYED